MLYSTHMYMYIYMYMICDILHVHVYLDCLECFAEWLACVSMCHYESGFDVDYVIFKT